MKQTAEELLRLIKRNTSRRKGKIYLSLGSGAKDYEALRRLRNKLNEFIE
jgi:hypothetical protein